MHIAEAILKGILIGAMAKVELPNGRPELRSGKKAEHSRKNGSAPVVAAKTADDAQAEKMARRAAPIICRIGDGDRVHEARS